MNVFPSSSIHSRRLVAVAVAAFVIATLLAYGVVAAFQRAGASSTDVSTPTSKPTAAIMQAEDHLPNSTTSDWVTYADFVVAVTAKDEVASPINAEDLKIGEGLIERRVTLDVDKVLWSRNPDTAPPKSVPWVGAGWVFDDHAPEKKIPMILPGTSRVEAGHSYVVAIKWEQPPCPDTSSKDSGSWTGLGGGAVLAFDDGVLGNGEFEGTERTADAAIAARRTSGQEALSDVGSRMLGSTEDALTKELASAKPDSDPMVRRPTCG